MSGKLAENVPQRDIDRGDRRHRHRAATPIRAAIQELPRVFDASRIAADEIRDHVLLEVGRNRQLAAVERRIAEPVDARARLDLQRDEIAPRTRDDHLRRDDRAVACRTLRRRNSSFTSDHSSMLLRKLAAAARDARPVRGVWRKRPPPPFDWFEYTGHDAVFSTRSRRAATAIPFSPASIRIRASRAPATFYPGQLHVHLLSPAFRCSRAATSCTGARSAT